MPDHWDDYKNYRLTHITCLNALAIVGNELINETYSDKTQQIDSLKIADKLISIVEIDWSSNGNLKFLKGMSGAKILSEDIRRILN